MSRSLATAVIGQSGVMFVDEPIRLYEGVAPGSEGWTNVERRYRSESWNTEVVTNVVVPTLVRCARVSLRTEPQWSSRRAAASSDCRSRARGSESPNA